MSYLIKTAVDEISNFVEQLNYIRGMVVLGSYARGDADLYSDIDLYFFGDESEKWEKFSENPVQLFEDIFGKLPFINFIPFEKGTHNLKSALWIIYLPINFIKIELHLIPKFTNDIEDDQFSLFFLESQIQNPQSAVIVDKDDSILPYLVHLSSNKPHFLADQKFEIEARKFLNYYESFYAPFNRGDLYRAHLYHNLCFYKLANLFYLEAGGKEHLYAPRNLTNKVLFPNPKFQKFVEILHEISSTMDPFEMRNKMDKIFDAYASFLKETSFPFSFPLHLIESFNKKIKEKYPPFYKFRDFGRSSLGETHLKPKKLYRSSTLTRYSPEEVFNYLRSQNIRIIIDLRNIEERRESPYSDEILHHHDYHIDYIHIPLILEGNYIQTLENRLSQISDILQKIADSADNPIVLHCVAGTDRTGIIIALLYLILGVPSHKIIEDFNLSVTQTCFDKIGSLINYIKERGGIESFLLQNQVPKSLISNLKQVLSRKF